MLTARLRLTPVGVDDVEALSELCGDPLIDAWTGPWTPGSIRAWAADMERRWAVDRVGKWLARDHDGGLVGRGGFTRVDLEGEQVLELGWAVRDHLTGRGYATEIGRAAIAWAAAHRPAIPIVAFTEVHNRASVAVMRRLGMVPDGVIHREGLVDGRPGLHPDAPFALHRLPPR